MPMIKKTKLHSGDLTLISGNATNFLLVLANEWAFI